MKRILSKGKVIVSLVSVFAVLAVSLLSMFTGVSLFVAAEDDTTESATVTYPINGEYDADFVKVEGSGISYEAIDYSKKTIVDTFTGFDTEFCVNSLDGDGTGSKPYIIKTANQFAAVVTGNLSNGNGGYIDTTGLFFKIADNVKGFNLSNTDSTVDFSGNMTSTEVKAALENATVKSGLDWLSVKSFNGRFDGNGAEVYGLKAATVDAAIFPLVGGNITIKNLTVKNCYFIGSERASVLMAKNYNSDTPVKPYNTAHKVLNCQLHSNVAITTYTASEAIQMCGVVIAQTVYPTESNLYLNDTLIYDNIAKHATRNITYGIVGNLHRTNSAFISNCIILDSAPHTLYYGSNAFNQSSFTYVYTNYCDGKIWYNYDGDIVYGADGNPVSDKELIGGYKISTGLKYRYEYLATGVGDVNANFNHFDPSGNNLTNNGKGYLKNIPGPMFNVTHEDVKGMDPINGIDAERWTYNQDGYPTPKIHKIREYSAGTTWTGECSVQLNEGDGSKSSPFIVSSVEDFVLMLTQPIAGANYKLANDIKINDTTNPNWTDNAKQWFTSNDVPVFEASLDGDGHTVSGVYYSGDQAGESAGLIPVVGTTANIRNIKVANCVINADKGSAGGLAGSVADKCQKVVKFDAVTIESSIEFNGDATFGGLVGTIGYSVAHISDSFAKSGGFFGAVIGEVKIKRCISLGAYPFGTTNFVRAENVYTDTNAEAFEGVTILEKSAMKGDAAVTNMPGLNFPISWKKTTAYPVPTGVAASSEGTVGEPWSGAVATKYASGDGTEASPYIIETPEQLAFFVYATTRNDGAGIKYYKLGADIYLNDVNSKLWDEKIGCLDWYSQRTTKQYNNLAYLNFDGDGYVVHGLFFDHTQGATEYVRAALFPMLGAYSTVSNLGLSNAYLAGTCTKEINDAIAGFVACVEDFDGAVLDSHDAAGNLEILADPEWEARAVKFKNCFIDHRSYISGYYTGGFFASPYSAPILENCIFTGTIGGHEDQYYSGTLTGCDSTYGSQLRGCISFPLNSEMRIVGGSGGSTWRSNPGYWVTVADPVYYFSTKMSYGGDFTKLSNPAQRIGDDAKEAMPLLDWENTWRTVDEGTPILKVFDKHRSPEALADKNNKRVFVDAEYFSLCDYTPPSTELSFDTGDPDIKIDSIVAPMYSPLSLPTITRPGYEFLGWFVWPDPAIPYDLGYHPARDLTLHAGWELKGVVQPFDEYPDTMWDIDSDYWILNEPGAKGGYKNAYVRNGSKSMHLLGVNTEPVDCLLNYEQMLEPGKSYTISFWVNTDQANHPATLLSLVHNSKPDYYNSAVAIENMAVVTGLKVGEWVQYSYSFTAQTKWVSLRATGGSSLWFDDVVMAELDGSISGNKLIHLGAGGAAAGGALSPKTGEVVSVAALISVIMACAVVAIISRKNLVEVIEG